MKSNIEISEKKDLVIAIAGNPNSGKTTVFNNMTGSRQHVGNWPGVTVEKKEAVLKRNGCSIRVVDLPGTYSLSAFSMDEIIARNFIINDKPDVVLNIVDASNLERNLYLTLQIIELGARVVLVLNMTDVAESMGYKIKVELLSELLGVPVVTSVARSNKGTEDILKTALKVADGELPYKEIKVNYGNEIEEEIGKLESIIERSIFSGNTAPRRYLAVSLLENDNESIKAVAQRQNGREILDSASKGRAHIESIYRDVSESVISDRRYGFIAGLIKETLYRPAVERITVSDKIDAVLVNRFLGLPIFALFMLITFMMTFTLGDPPVRWLNTLFTEASLFMSSLLGDTMFGSLIVDGIIGGVGGVVAFLPNIMLLFFAIAILEDSGYMSRAAFIMDRVMHLMGLHGKSFIPMLVGLGCSVPAVMSARMLENRKDRIVTMLVVPLVSCGARLPVYILLAGAFFPGELFGRLRTAGLVVFVIYITGIVLAVVIARIFRSTIFKGPDSPFVMELPPYRKPHLKSALIHTWERSWMYLRKAGTIILALTVLMWFLMSYPKLPDTPSGDTAKVAARKLEYSFAGRFAKFVEPVMRPIGFDRRATIAVFSGLAAKELIVTTLGTEFSLGGGKTRGESLSGYIRRDPNYNPLFAISLMLFTLTSVPCVATLAIIKRETGSWAWPAFSAVYHFALAWILCFSVWQTGRLLGLGG